MTPMTSVWPMVDKTKLLSANEDLMFGKNFVNVYANIKGTTIEEIKNYYFTSKKVT